MSLRLFRRAKAALFPYMRWRGEYATQARKTNWGEERIHFLPRAPPCSVIQHGEHKSYCLPVCRGSRPVISMTEKLGKCFPCKTQACKQKSQDLSQTQVRNLHLLKWKRKIVTLQAQKNEPNKPKFLRYWALTAESVSLRSVSIVVFLEYDRRCGDTVKGVLCLLTKSHSCKPTKFSGDQCTSQFQIFRLFTVLSYYYNNS